MRLLFTLFLFALPLAGHPASEQEQPPLAGAARNAQGCWEADLDLGRCRMRMVLIPAGTFVMGAKCGSYDDWPQHQVTISHAFWLGKYPVTQAQWRAVLQGNPEIRELDPSDFKGDDRPVECVCWTDAQKFIRAVNKAVGGPAFRLPTESEWEFACRAGSTEDAYGKLDAIAWYVGNSGGRTHPVGQKAPNGFGLHDMLGNVRQWCQDWHGPYPSGPVTDPQGAATGSFRIMRGGCWDSEPESVQAAVRGRGEPNRLTELGFRLVRNAP